MLHKLRVEEGEAHELGLVQVHHEQLVGGRQLDLLAGELLVKVAHVLAVFLRREMERGGGYRHAVLVFRPRRAYASQCSISRRQLTTDEGHTKRDHYTIGRIMRSLRARQISDPEQRLQSIRSFSSSA